jgi:hypothetical protein
MEFLNLADAHLKEYYTISVATVGLTSPKNATNVVNHRLFWKALPEVRMGDSE